MRKKFPGVLRGGFFPLLKKGGSRLSGLSGHQGRPREMCPPKNWGREIQVWGACGALVGGNRSVGVFGSIGVPVLRGRKPRDWGLGV